MKKILVCLSIALVMTQLQANAFDWISALKFWETAAETQTAEVQSVKTLADIETQMAAVDQSVQNAFVNIVSEVATRKVKNAVKSELKANADNIAEVISNYAGTIAKDEMKQTISKLSAKEKTALVNNLSVLSEDAQQYLLLATDGVKAATNTIKTAQKLSEVATTISNANRVASELKTRATSVINLANQMKTIASAAGLKVQ